jgi:aminoglycoside phosphotransferase (APT) family kinase protein
VSTLSLPPDRLAWIAGVTKGRVTRAARLYGGGSRQTHLVDVETTAGERLALVLKLETGSGAHAGTSFSIAREYEVYAALASTSVPLPRVFGLSCDGDALLLERLPGTSDLRKVPTEERRRVAADFMRAMAALHSLDITRLCLPGFARPVSPQEHARLDLARWRELMRTRTPDDEPLIRYAFTWLDAHAPQHVQRTCLVQGDTGPGNFMAEGGRLTGIIDWEFSHIGDPMTDLGWLRLRCQTPEEYSMFADAFVSYEADSGLTLDSRAIDYHHAFALLRCTVTVAMAIRAGGALSPIQYWVAYHDYLPRLAGSLLALQGHGPERVPLPSTQANSIADLGASALRAHVLPALTDRRARIATHAAHSALRHYSLRDAIGSLLEAAETQDQRDTFGCPISMASLCQRCEDTVPLNADLLRYLSRRVTRRAALWPTR